MLSSKSDQPFSWIHSHRTPSPQSIRVTSSTSPLLHPFKSIMDKRKDPPTSEGVLIKRQKPEDTATPSNAVTIQTKGASGALIQTV